jgi:hypothetical protein
MNRRLILIAFAALPLLCAATFADPPEGNVQTQVVPFLGIATMEATPEERAAARLPEGVGLTVQHVLENSPAASAGLKRFDVLVRLDDQLLINDPQFRVLTRMRRPGDAIDLHVIRGGEPLTLTAVLDQRKIPVADVPPNELVQWLIRPSQRTGFSASYEDDQHVLIITTDDQGKYLVAKDKQGTTLFSGPINTEQQRSGVPEVLLKKLELLEMPPKSTPRALFPRLQQPETSPTG